MASTRTAPSTAKLPASEPGDEIVELRPPQAFGFSGTHKIYRLAQADVLKLLLDLGYTIVEATNEEVADGRD